MKKRLLSILLTLCILLCAMPTYIVSAGTTVGGVRFYAIDGTPSDISNESYSKLLDDNTTTKWCTDITNEVYIIIKASSKVALNGYSFVTGNDTATAGEGRNPKDWVLYGCNDYNTSDKSGSWSLLHSVSNDTTMQDKNYATYDFYFANSVEYQYYKLVIKKSKGDNMMQLSEMRFKLTENNWYTPEGGKAISLGTDAILNPVVGGGKWQHLYFGNYNEKPIDFRILSKNISDFGDKTMFLENADCLFEAKFDDDEDTRQWDQTTLKTNLNGDFYSDVFEIGEQASIHLSKKSSLSPLDYNGTLSNTYKFVQLTGDRVFVLDLREYGSSTYGFADLNVISASGKQNDLIASNIFKTTSGKYLTRTFNSNVYQQTVALFTSSNAVYNILKYTGNISPSLNIKLSSVLFTKNVSGNIDDYNEVYHKLSILSSTLGVSVTDNVIKTDNTVKIPYTVTGDDATQLSVMILNKPYTAGNTNGAAIKYYAKSADVTEQKSGTVNLNLPSEFSDKVPCKDYYIYLIAEDINGEKATDYAGTPAPVIPKSTVTYNAGTNGTGIEKTVYKISGTDLTLENALFTRDTYAQTGWSLTDGGAKAYDLGAIYIEEKDIVLYPVWEKIIYTINVTYNAPADNKNVTLSGGWDTAVLNGFTDPTYNDGKHTLEFMGLSYYDSSSKKLIDITSSTMFKDIIKDSTKTTISLTVTPKWKYNAPHPAELLWAVQNKISHIVLQKDIFLSEDLDFSVNSVTEHTCTTLDLNGYALTGKSEITLLNADLILIDSRSNAAHSDYTLPFGGVIGDGIAIYATSSDAVNWASSTIYANGGTVLGDVQLKSKNQSFITNTADTVTVFAGNVRAFSNISGGIYLKQVAIDSGSKNKITKGVFYGGLTDESCLDKSKTFTLYFDLTNVQGNIPNQIFVGVDSYKALEPENIPTADGRTFMCWSTDIGKIFDFETDEISKNTILFPCWEIMVSNADELNKALRDGFYSIVLGNDISFDRYVTFYSSTHILDLNGHILSNSTPERLQMYISRGNLTICDSAPNIVHNDTSLPAGGIIDGFEIDISLHSDNHSSETVLYANGGTITSEVLLLHKNASIASNGGVPTNFKGNVRNDIGTISGGRYFKPVQNSSVINGGSFFGGIISKGDSSSVTGKKFTVKYDAAGGTEILPQIFVNVSSEKMCAPAAPAKSGYKFAYWNKNGTYFDFNYTVKSNLTLTAVWVVPGDANGDGNVNITDLIRMKKYAAGSAEYTKSNKSASDMDDNGSIDSIDLTIIRKLLLGVLD